MRRRLALLALLAAALVTTACAAGGGSAAPASTPSAAASTSTPAAAPSPTPTSSATPFALIASVSAVTLVDTSGAALRSAPFTDGAAVLDLLSGAIGQTPAGVRSDRYATTTYDWTACTLTVSDGGGARLAIAATQVGSLELRADGGLAVGSPSAAAIARGAVADPSDPGQLRFEVTEAPGTTSLANGGTGVDFVALVIEGGAITRILAPSDDHSDL